MNEQDLKNILARNPQLTASDNHTSGIKGVQSTKRQPNPPQTLASVPRPEIESLGRPVVRITSYRVRELDDENFAWGCKALFDGLQEAGLIKSDSRKDIDREYEQIKVTHQHQEETVIRIRYE